MEYLTLHPVSHTLPYTLSMFDVRYTVFNAQLFIDDLRSLNADHRTRNRDLLICKVRIFFNSVDSTMSVV